MRWFSKYRPAKGSFRSQATEDGWLMWRVRWGSLQAFDLLMARYVSPVLTLCHYYLGDERVAQDMTEEIFLKTHDQLKNMSPRMLFRETFFHWLLRFTLDHCKAAEYQGRMTQRHRGSELLDLTECLVQLIPQHREAVVLFHILRLDYEDTALILQVSPGTIQTRLHTARLKLKDLSKKNQLLNV